MMEYTIPKNGFRFKVPRFQVKPCDAAVFVKLPRMNSRPEMQNALKRVGNEPAFLEDAFGVAGFGYQPGNSFPGMAQGNITVN
jgi:hypothetical protein